MYEGRRKREKREVDAGLPSTIHCPQYIVHHVTRLLFGITHSIHQTLPLPTTIPSFFFCYNSTHNDAQACPIISIVTHYQPRAVHPNTTNTRSNPTSKYTPRLSSTRPAPSIVTAPSPNHELDPTAPAFQPKLSPIPSPTPTLVSTPPPQEHSPITSPKPNNVPFPSLVNSSPSRAAALSPPGSPYTPPPLRRTTSITSPRLPSGGLNKPISRRASNASTLSKASVMSEGFRPTSATVAPLLTTSDDSTTRADYFDTNPQLWNGVNGGGGREGSLASSEAETLAATTTSSSSSKDSLPLPPKATLKKKSSFSLPFTRNRTTSSSQSKEETATVEPKNGIADRLKRSLSKR